jgi:hypothetical protein
MFLKDLNSGNNLIINIVRVLVVVLRGSAALCIFKK